MRPAPGASTAPSLACCSITPRSERIAASVALGDVERGLGVVELHLRADAAPLQLLRAIEVGLRLVALRLLRLDALIERLHLQGQLLVGDDGDLGAGRDACRLP